MKIISRKQLMEMPAGTIFSYYEPCIFDGLYCSGGSFGSDFTVQQLVCNIQADNSDEYIENCTEMEKGGSIPLDFESYGREGLFNDEQLYAVYDKKDVQDLIKFLQVASPV